MRTTGSAIAGVAVAVLMVTACTSSASSTAPSGTPAASISSAGNQNDMVLDQAAVVLDGTVLSAPLIAAPIAGGHLEISGNFTRAAVGELAAELQGGPLPVAFRIAGTSTFNQPASS
jgi:preprotein translocase subunit SecD